MMHYKICIISGDKHGWNPLILSRPDFTWCYLVLGTTAFRWWTGWGWRL